MLKSYKYRLYPTKKQQKLLNKHFGCVRYIYNWALELKTKTYTQDKKKLSFFDLGNLLPQLKKENKWLKEVNSQSLQQSLKHMDSVI
jgi:putative transposase